MAMAIPVPGSQRTSGEGLLPASSGCLTPKGQARQAGRAMLKRLLATVRKYPLLKLLLCSHAMIIVVLLAYYYLQAETALWHSLLYVPIIRNTEGEWLYQIVARGPSLLLPWHFLPQHVFWLALDILVFGSLTMWLAYRIVGNEVGHQVAGREKAAADKLLEVEEESAAADDRMREAGAREERLKVLESRVATRESEAANRELKTQRHVEDKDAEMNKMSVALRRLKGEKKDLQDEVRQLRGDS